MILDEYGEAVNATVVFRELVYPPRPEIHARIVNGEMVSANSGPCFVPAGDYRVQTTTAHGEWRSMTEIVMDVPAGGLRLPAGPS